VGRVGGVNPSSIEEKEGTTASNSSIFEGEGGKRKENKGKVREGKRNPGPSHAPEVNGNHALQSKEESAAFLTRKKKPKKRHSNSTNGKGG